jgi:hypothetical protein
VGGVDRTRRELRTQGVPVPLGGRAFDIVKVLAQSGRWDSAAVKAYLVAAGVPASEVSGTHVTTTIAGGGPVRDGVQPAQSKLLWYTTHLERSLGGIPVESSYAFVWPAIPAGVVSNARAFAERLAASRERTAFMAKVRKAAPGAEDMPGSVKIVHTSGRYHGPFQAAAVYSTVVPSRRGGKRKSCALTRPGLSYG